MNTIREEVTSLYEIERSSFYGILAPIQSEEEAKKIIDKIRKQHPKARHVCYAYIVNQTQKSNDDGEPKGTAGRPLLELLNQYQLQNVILLVVRYFGGIKLGAGRLLRSYVETGALALKKAGIYSSYEAYRYELHMSPKIYDAMMRAITKINATIEECFFLEEVVLTINSKKDIRKEILEISQGQVQIEELEKIEKWEKKKDA